MAEDFSPQGRKDPAKDLLVPDRLRLQTIGNDVVDVLDEDKFPLDRIEIFQKRTVAGRPEQQPAVAVAEGPVVEIDGDRPG